MARHGCTGGSLLRASILILALVNVACAGPTRIPEIIHIPAGEFWFGSGQEEREHAYILDERAYGHSKTRNLGWYEDEPNLQKISLNSFYISKYPITNGQYQDFLVATDHPPPRVEESTWRSYGLIHPYTRTKRHQWVGQNFPTGREQHPVVLVSHADAMAYANWLSEITGETWRLPTEQEWVKSARGTDGRRFPWGDSFNAGSLNSHDSGPFDTVPVNTRSAPSPFGMTDAAGQVFEWMYSTDEAARAWVKGGSWDDKGCGVCRPAARHSRPKLIKHILIGFRLVKQ